MEKKAVHGSAERDYLLLLHRWVAVLATPFVLLSILVAVGLTHSDLLNRLSERLFDSLAIPQVALDENVTPGSWEQAIKVASLATGSQGQVVTSRDKDTVVVQAFMKHSHDPRVMKINPHTQVVVDTRTMDILRIQDKNTSLIHMGHAIHAYRFFDMEYFSLSMVTSTALILMLITGGALAWRDTKAKRRYERAALLWHVRLGQLVGLLLIVIVITTLDFEFSFVSGRDRATSHPIPTIQLDGPLQPGSIDQARKIAAQAIGALPQGVFIRKNGDDVKFSQTGDGIGGKSVWMNINDMTIQRITDWRNDKQALMFILHDGRWLGGMNALNINDVAALILLWLVLGGFSQFVINKWKVR